MKNVTLPPAQEAVYSQLFTENPLRKIQFDQAYSLVQQHRVLQMNGGMEHEDILEALSQVEAEVGRQGYSKKVRKRIFMAACELMLSREMGLFDPIAFALAFTADAAYIFVQMPVETGEKQFEWLSNLQQLDDLLGGLNSMSDKELKHLKLRLLNNPYDEGTYHQNIFNWLDVARRCEVPLLYDFQLETPAACYASIIARVPVNQ